MSSYQHFDVERVGVLGAVIDGVDLKEPLSEALLG